MLYQCLVVSRDDKDFFDGIYIDELKILLNHFLEGLLSLIVDRSNQEIV